MEGLLAYIKAIEETVACSRILGPIVISLCIEEELASR